MTSAQMELQLAKVEAQHTIDNLKKRIQDFESGVAKSDSLQQLLDEQQELLEQKDNLLRIKSSEIEDRDDRLIE